MKRIITVLSCIFLVSIFLACDIGSLSLYKNISPDKEQGKSYPAGDFTVGIERLVLSSNELATVPSRNPDLKALITPAFATEKQLRWTSDNPSAAEINETTGVITVRTAAVDEPLSTIIRVEAIADPSKYDVCVLTVYPNYPRNRTWTFGTAPALVGNVALPDGATLLFDTGFASTYTDGNIGPGLYIIDPEDPYAYGILPTGAVRSGTTYDAGALTGFLYPNKTTSIVGHLRTSGNASRVMSIAALFSPFTFAVNYRSNGSGDRWADIRIGDREGLRIQGEFSSNDNAGARTVWYSYDPSDPDKPEYGKDEFVPLVFVEAKAGIRLHSVYILEGVYEETSTGLARVK